MKYTRISESTKTNTVIKINHVGHIGEEISKSCSSVLKTRPEMEKDETNSMHQGKDTCSWCRFVFMELVTVTLGATALHHSYWGRSTAGSVVLATSTTVLWGVSSHSLHLLHGSKQHQARFELLGHNVGGSTKARLEHQEPEQWFEWCTSSYVRVNISIKFSLWITASW